MIPEQVTTTLAAVPSWALLTVAVVVAVAVLAGVGLAARQATTVP